MDGEMMEQQLTITIPVTQPVEETRMAQLLLGGWRYVGVFLMGSTGVATPQNPNAGAPEMQHLWIRPVPMIPQQVVMGAVLEVAGERAPLDALCLALFGQPLAHFQQIQMAMMQAPESGELNA